MNSLDLGADAETWLILAKASEKLENWALCKHACENVLKDFPQHLSTLKVLSGINQSIRDERNAAKTSQMLKRLRPDYEPTEVKVFSKIIRASDSEAELKADTWEEVIQYLVSTKKTKLMFCKPEKAKAEKQTVTLKSSRLLEKEKQKLRDSSEVDWEQIYSNLDLPFSELEEVASDVTEIDESILQLSMSVPEWILMILEKFSAAEIELKPESLKNLLVLALDYFDFSQFSNSVLVSLLEALGSNPEILVACRLNFMDEREDSLLKRLHFIEILEYSLEEQEDLLCTFSASLHDLKIQTRNPKIPILSKDSVSRLIQEAKEASVLNEIERIYSQKHNTTQKILEFYSTTEKHIGSILFDKLETSSTAARHLFILADQGFDLNPSMKNVIQCLWALRLHWKSNDSNLLSSLFVTLIYILEDSEMETSDCLLNALKQKGLLMPEAAKAVLRILESKRISVDWNFVKKVYNLDSAKPFIDSLDVEVVSRYASKVEELPLSICEAILESSPQPQLAVRNKIQMYFDSGIDPEKLTEKTFFTSNQIESVDLAKVALQLGHIYSKQNKKKATDVFLKAIQYNPFDKLAWKSFSDHSLATAESVMISSAMNLVQVERLLVVALKSAAMADTSLIRIIELLLVRIKFGPKKIKTDKIYQSLVSLLSEAEEDIQTLMKLSKYTQKAKFSPAIILSFCLRTFEKAERASVQVYNNVKFLIIQFMFKYRNNLNEKQKSLLVEKVFNCNDSPDIKFMQSQLESIKDKSNPQIIYFISKIKALSDPKSALEEMQEIVNFKKLKIAKQEVELPGSNFTRTRKYILFYLDLLRQVRDFEEIGLVAKKSKSLASYLVNPEEIYKACIRILFAACKESKEGKEENLMTDGMTVQPNGKTTAIHALEEVYKNVKKSEIGDFLKKMKNGK